MEQFLVLSGKGGTGKTTIASGLIQLSRVKGFADCDVDAPNLHLVMAQEQLPKTKNYYGMKKAFIHAEKCIFCDRCRQICRFNAISIQGKEVVDIAHCEGCGVCQLVCPANAITMEDAVAGELQLYETKETIFSTARLKMGSGTSGKLVASVKNQLKDRVEESGVVIIDGSPGIGCPVLASLSGVDVALIVAEPSVSSISDMDRIVKTAKNMHVKTLVCVNKYDLNLENTKKIEEYCSQYGLPFVGKIPFDEKAMEAINQGKTIVEIDCPSGKAVIELYQQIKKYSKI